MTRVIYKTFYGLPLYRIVGFMIILILLWYFLDHYLIKQSSERILWKLGNALSFAGMICVILVVTISSRSQGSEVILRPLNSFVEARTNVEIYRSMLMNVFLFFPLGLTLPYALPEKWKHQVWLTIVLAMLFSLGIEFAQYYFSLGRAETDDVICNTLGCAIGTLAFVKRKTLKQNN